MTTEKCPSKCDFCGSEMRMGTLDCCITFSCGSYIEDDEEIIRTQLCHALERAQKAEAEVVDAFEIGLKQAEKFDDLMSAKESEVSEWKTMWEKTDQHRIDAEREVTQLREKLKKALEVGTIAYRYGANGIFGYDALEARKFRTQFEELLGAKDVQLKEGE